MVKDIRLSEVITMIKSGKTRKRIISELELNTKQTTELFNHPAIKNIRAARTEGLNIIDDTMLPNDLIEESIHDSIYNEQILFPENN